MKWWTVLAPVLVGCVSDLTLPERPGSLEIAGLAPAHAFAGDSVEVAGRGFGAHASVLRVSFGNGTPVVPVAVDDAKLVVVVPDDATSGDVVVESPRGRSTGGPFTVDGRGRLRHGREGASRDLRAHLDVAFPVGHRAFGLDAEYYDQAVIVGETTGSLGLRSLVTARPWDGGAVVLDNDRTGLDRSDCGGHLTIVDGDGRTQRRIPLEIGDPDCEAFVDLAIGPDGVAAALAYYHVVFVDLASGATETLPIDATNGYVAALGAGAFLLAQDEGVQRIRRGADGWVLDSLELTDDTWLTTTVAGSPSGRGASLLSSGVVVVFDATVWPPVVEHRLGLDTDTADRGNRDGRIALTPDGGRLAFASPYVHQVTTWRLGEGVAAPLGSAFVESPRHIVAGSDGAFYVADRGAMVVVSQETGVFVQRFAITAGLTPPQLRRTEVPGVSGPSTRLVLEIAASRFDSLLRFDATTLAPLEHEPLVRLAPGPRVTQLASSISGRLVVVRGNTLHRALAGPTLAFETSAWDSGADELEAMLTADGASLALLETASKSELALLAQGSTSPLVRWPAPDLRRALADESRLALVYKDFVAVHDVRRLAETKDPRASRTQLVALPTGWRVDAATLARGRVFVIAMNDDGTERRLFVIDASTGVLAEGDPLPVSSSNSGLTVSPSGRQLWTFDYPGGMSFHSFDIDSSTGALLGSAPRTVVPDFSDGLAAYPDGERVAYVETAQDRLVVRE